MQNNNKKNRQNTEEKQTKHKNGKEWYPVLLTWFTILCPLPQKCALNCKQRCSGYIVYTKYKRLDLTWPPPSCYLCIKKFIIKIREFMVEFNSLPLREKTGWRMEFRLQSERKKVSINITHIWRFKFSTKLNISHIREKKTVIHRKKRLFIEHHL